MRICIMELGAHAPVMLLVPGQTFGSHSSMAHFWKPQPKPLPEADTDRDVSLDRYRVVDRSHNFAKVSTNSWSSRLCCASCQVYPVVMGSLQEQLIVVSERPPSTCSEQQLQSGFCGSYTFSQVVVQLLHP